MYRGSPTYTKITNTVSTTTVCKWGDFCVSNMVFSKSQNVHKAWTLCSEIMMILTKCMWFHVQLVQKILNDIYLVVNPWGILIFRSKTMAKAVLPLTRVNHVASIKAVFCAVAPTEDSIIGNLAA